MKSLLPLLALAAAASAQNYSAVRATEDGIEIVRLADAASGVEVKIAPSIGNRAYAMNVHGRNILDFPYASLSEFRDHPALCGIPFLAPWANRLSEQGFWANGRRYAFNMSLGNVRGAIPIHGFLSTSPDWQVSEIRADGEGARVTSRLEFWRDPEMMAQWPFAHEYEMTYRLSGGVLEVRIAVHNLSREPMPLAIGFHPYYKIPGIPRDRWTAHIPARKHVEAVENLPTGEFTANRLPGEFSLAGHTFDDGFTDLVRESDGRAHFRVSAEGKTVEAMFGAHYPVAVVWAPNKRDGTAQDFICFEPMTGITNAVNLAHEGKYGALQSVAPGQTWTESFWLRATGM